MKPTREAYGEMLVTLGATHDFYVMDADLSKATQTCRFASKYPDRFFNIGIAEANLMCFAAGLSTLGSPVFASSFATFASGRAFDQVRNTLAYSNCNVKIGATHAGISVGPDGGSHQCIEDIALMRAIPNMVVLCPCDWDSTQAYVKAALEHNGPVYLRFSRSATPTVYENGGDFQIGKGTVVCDGTDVTIIAIGDMVAKSITAAKELAAQNISARVVDMASVKPIDRELVIACGKETGCIVTAEDHNIMGGLGGAVSEIIVSECPVPMELVGVQDKFGISGLPPELADHFNINEAAIIQAAKKAISRK